ncbi:MAG: DUF2500 domain-containing protein [Ruminococcaceae bacterium]|nr:DUF2500 domain-containing protein [Oscillospiraceae bacterium]
MKNIFDNIEIKDNYILFHRHGNGWSSTSRWEISEFIVFIAIAALLTALFVWFVVSYIKFIRRRTHSAEPYDTPAALPEICTVSARVIAKDCELVKFGSKTQSSHKIIYWAEFLTDDGKTLKYEIPAEIYDNIALLQTGTLATTEDNFFYFGDGETIE